MSTGKKSDYIILAVLGAICVVVLLLTLLGRSGPSDDDFWFGTRSSASRKRSGMVVCYALYEQLGADVFRSYHPVSSAVLDEMNVLFLVDPFWPVGAEEVSDVGQWVHLGGTLVCSTDSLPAFVAPLLGEGEMPAKESHRMVVPRVSPRIKVDEEKTRIPDDAMGLPLARGVASLRFSTGRTIELGPEALRCTYLLRDDAGLRAAEFRMGSGRVILLSDSSFLSNGLIGDEDNSVAAVNLLDRALATASGGRVAFDEYHFGHARPHAETGWSVMRALLFTTSPGWAMLCLTLAGALLLVQRGWRFGPRRVPGRQRRRSKLEFIRSVASTYRAAKAHGLTFSILYAWTRRRIARWIGAPPACPSSDLAARLARRMGRPIKRYERVLAACDEAARAHKTSQFRVSGLLSQLAEIEMEIFDGRPRR